MKEAPNFTGCLFFVQQKKVYFASSEVIKAALYGILQGQDRADLPHRRKTEILMTTQIKLGDIAIDLVRKDQEHSPECTSTGYTSSRSVAIMMTCF